MSVALILLFSKHFCSLLIHVIDISFHVEWGLDSSVHSGVLALKWFSDNSVVVIDWAKHVVAHNLLNHTYLSRLVLVGAHCCVALAINRFTSNKLIIL